MGRFFKIDLNTKDTSSIPFGGNPYISYPAMVADKQGNLIAFKVDGTNFPDYVAQFVQIDLNTGAQTVIKTLSEDDIYFTPLCFLPKRNEIAGIWDYKNLYQFNVSTKASSTRQLTTQSNFRYYKVTSN